MKQGPPPAYEGTSTDTRGPETAPFLRGGVLPKLAEWLERFFVTHRDRLVLVHVAMFFIFLGLLFTPLFLDTPPSGARSLDHFTSAANVAIWAVWFPLVFLSVVFSGRSWCGILCPMGAASEWANARGLRREIPRWVRWPGTPVISFVIITIWAQTAGARVHAPATAIVFGTVLIAAIALGFLYGRNKRAWCRHMCPIGLLLGVYARIGAVDFFPKRPKPGGDVRTERTACPTMIDLDRKTESRHCIECFRCVSPQAKGGLYFKLRVPGSEIADIRHHNANLAEVLFVFIGTGLALGGFLWIVLDSYQALRLRLGTWIIEQGWTWLGEPGPLWLMAVYPEEREVFRWFDFFLISGYMLAWAALAVVVLGGLAGLAAWIAGRSGATGSTRERFVELGYQFLPIAMISLLLGLGSELFSDVETLGLGAEGTRAVKFSLLVLSGFWSLRLGYQLLANQGLDPKKRWVPLIPGLAGIVAVGAAWSTAML